MTLRAHFDHRVGVTYPDDLAGLPRPAAERVLAGWRLLADLGDVQACPHVVDPNTDARRHTQRLPDGRRYVCAAHPRAGVLCPGCATRHLTRPDREHRECRRCGGDLAPFDTPRPRVNVSTVVAARDGGAARPFGETVATVGVDVCGTCDRYGEGAR